MYFKFLNKKSKRLSSEIINNILKYITDNYNDFGEATTNIVIGEDFTTTEIISDAPDCTPAYGLAKEKVVMMPCRSGNSLNDFLSTLDESFSEALFRFIDEKGITDIECYKRARVDRKTFSKIKCNKDYKPGKATAISFAIALKLNLSETQHLLKTLGFTLSHSNKADVIIEYFIINENYNIFDINEALLEFDQPLLNY